MEPVCWIIGVLDDGLASLPTASRQILPQAQTVIGSQRLLELVAPLLSPGVRSVAIQRPAEEAPHLVAEAWQRGEQVAALSTGDPLFFGMGSLLLKHFPTSRLHILPNLSYLQIALARLHLSGEEAIKLSVHRGASGPWQPGAGPDHALYPFIRQLSHHRPLAILTSPANSPGLLAHALQSEGLAASWRLSVCEQLCRPEEKISRHLTMEQVMAGDWSFPNVVVAHPVDTPPLFPLFGQDEALFHHGEGRILVTRREIRAVALAQMALTGNEIIWDIGAGSGSVALEAARLCPQG
ncbi:MAG: precorrin-6y C5,15-methyltransferase (decarboxylating) subunit CbiE, partial [Magnetococcales bacterium]|nr:precorrin-6y C5,15-methyltransferase (decarboxylating) subunit CbiE [Magnetococcales bacterium]